MKTALCSNKRLICCTCCLGMYEDIESCKFVNFQQFLQIFLQMMTISASLSMSKVASSLDNFALLFSLMRVVQSLLLNPHIHIEPYVSFDFLTFITITAFLGVRYFVVAFEFY